MGVSINGNTPRWLVYNGQSVFKMDDLEVPPFQETSILRLSTNFQVIPSGK